MTNANREIPYSVFLILFFFFLHHLYSNILLHILLSKTQKLRSSFWRRDRTDMTASSLGFWELNHKGKPVLVCVCVCVAISVSSVKARAKYFPSSAFYLSHYTDVKLSLSPWGKNMNCRCLRAGYWGQCLNSTERIKYMTENILMRNSINFTLHVIILELL